jgi:HEAT repeat-containing protein 5
VEALVTLFAGSSEPEMPGHSVLEQYQAQVSAALRPALTAETTPDVTATAFRACAVWLCSGVMRAASDTRKTLQLLVDPLAVLAAAPRASYNESATTMMRVALLEAWADVFFAAQKSNSVRSSLVCRAADPVSVLCCFVVKQRFV